MWANSAAMYLNNPSAQRKLTTQFNPCSEMTYGQIFVMTSGNALKLNLSVKLYGASESNLSFLNLLNKDYTIATTDEDLMLVKYNIDNDKIIGDADGKLIEVAEEDAGLLLAKIDDKYVYDGYKNKDVSDSKLLRDVKEVGDSWFNRDTDND